LLTDLPSNFSSLTLWKSLKEKNPKIEKFIPHPQFRKREDGEIENDVIMVQAASQIFAKDEPFVPICLPAASTVQVT
jgi:hypothetical protein